MKKFQEYLSDNEVRKCSPDIGLAKSLQKDAEQRVELILQLKLNEKSATLIYEQVYETLREYTDALLALNGFKSYSHIASIVFLKNYEQITHSEINKLNNAREKRNLSKYYAKQVSIAETEEIIEFHKQIQPKLKIIFNQLIEKKTTKY